MSIMVVCSSMTTKPYWMHCALVFNIFSRRIVTFLVTWLMSDCMHKSVANRSFLGIFNSVWIYIFFVFFPLLLLRRSLRNFHLRNEVARLSGSSNHFTAYFFTYCVIYIFIQPQSRSHSPQIRIAVNCERYHFWSGSIVYISPQGA